MASSTEGASSSTSSVMASSSSTESSDTGDKAPAVVPPHIQDMLNDMNVQLVPLSHLTKPMFCSLLFVDMTLKVSQPNYMRQMKMIGLHVMTYLNTSGGTVIVKFTRHFTRKHADEWEVKVKQYLSNFMTDSTFRKCIRIRINLDTDDAEIIIDKADTLITFQSNLYVRVGSACQEIRDQNELWHELHKAPAQSRVVPQRSWHGLSYGDVIPEDETSNLEFKCYQVSGVAELTRKIKSDVIKGRDITAFERVILSFPQNVAIGKVITGIREDEHGNKIVWGQELREEEEEIFTQFLDSLFKESPSGIKRIWGEESYQPKLGTDYHVQYHPVSSTPDNKRRVLIEMTIEHFTGGVFGGMPICTIHDNDGIIRAMSFVEWKMNIDNMHSMATIKDSMDVDEESPLPESTNLASGIDSKASEADANTFSLDLDIELQQRLTHDLKVHNRHLLPRQDFSWSSGSEHWCLDKRVGTLSPHDLLNLSCAQMLRPETPANVTPRKQVLLGLMQDDANKFVDFLNSIEAHFINEKVAVLWSQNILEMFQLGGISRPSGHISDFMALSEREILHVWTCCKSEGATDEHKTYVCDVIRRLHKLMLDTSQNICHIMGLFVSKISFEGHVYCLDAGQVAFDVKQYEVDDASTPIKAIQLILAALLLTGEIHIKSRLGEELLISLTRSQMETVFNLTKAKVSVIQGPPGSGKTVMALYLCEMLMRQTGLTKEQICYMCPNEPLAVYITQQEKCRVTTITSGDMMVLAVSRALKEGVKCFILDDVQVLDVKRKHWKKLFQLLDEKLYQDVQLRIFTDSIYQNFLSSSAHKLVVALEEYISEHPFFSYYKAPPLHEMLRNSRKVFSFFKANVSDEHASKQLTCRHDVIGDDITVLYCPDILLKSADNPVVQVVGQLLVNDADSAFTYEPSDIAVLVDSSGKSKAKKASKLLLELSTTFLPSAKAQSALDVPVKGVVVDELEKYSGLDARACICVLTDKSSARKKLNDYRFKLFVASRGVCRVTFMVHGKASKDVLQQMRFSEDLMWNGITGELFQVLCTQLSSADHGTIFDISRLPQTEHWMTAVGTIMRERITLAIEESTVGTDVEEWLVGCEKILAESAFTTTVPWNYYLEQVRKRIESIELSNCTLTEKIEAITKLLPPRHHHSILQSYADDIHDRMTQMVLNNGHKDKIADIILNSVMWEMNKDFLKKKLEELLEAKLVEKLYDNEADKESIISWLSDCVPEALVSHMRSYYSDILKNELSHKSSGDDFTSIIEKKVPEALKEEIIEFLQNTLAEKVDAISRSVKYSMDEKVSLIRDLLPESLNPWIMNKYVSDLKLRLSNIYECEDHPSRKAYQLIDSSPIWTIQHTPMEQYLTGLLLEKLKKFISDEQTGESMQNWHDKNLSALSYSVQDDVHKYYAKILKTEAEAIITRVEKPAEDLEQWFLSRVLGYAMNETKEYLDDHFESEFNKHLKVIKSQRGTNRTWITENVPRFMFNRIRSFVIDKYMSDFEELCKAGSYKSSMTDFLPEAEESYDRFWKTEILAKMIVKLHEECLDHGNYSDALTWADANLPDEILSDIFDVVLMELTDVLYRTIFKDNKIFEEKWLDKWLDEKVPAKFHKALRKEHKTAMNIEEKKLFTWRKNQRKAHHNTAALRMKVVMVGDGAVGATAIIISSLKGYFYQQYIPTVFDNWVHDVTVDEQVVEVAIWETAGQEDYDRLRPLSYPDTDVAIVVYSVSSPSSAENVTAKWMPEIRHHLPKVPVILVGTKTDERKDWRTLRNLLQNYRTMEGTTYKDGIQLAAEIGAHGYLECSSKTGEGTTEVFETAARIFLSKK